MFTHIVEAQVERQSLCRSFENQLVDPQFLEATLQFFRHTQVIEPMGYGNLHDVGGLSSLGLGQIKGQLPPHVGKLKVVGAKQQLAGMKRAARGVTDLAVGLNHRLPQAQMLTKFVGNTVENFGEQGLVLFVEGQGIPIGRKAVHVVLGKIWAPNHAQLAEESHSRHYPGVLPHPAMPWWRRGPRNWPLPPP